MYNNIMVDQSGRHGLACRKSAGRHHRHNSVNDLIKRALTSANCPAILEPKSLCRSDGKRPDGMTVQPWTQGRCLVWDVTCPDTLATSHINRALIGPGTVATDAETKKRVKYTALAPLYHFCPIAIETFGAMGESAINFLHDLGRRIAQITEEPKSLAYLTQRLSVTIQRGNALCVMSTLSSSEKLDEVKMSTRSRYFGVLTRLVNIRVKVEKDGQKAVVNFNGTTMDDINRAGRIGISRILHWFTSSRLYAYNVANEQTGTAFLEYDRMTNNYFTFMASSKSSIESAFYSYLNAGLAFPPMDIEIHLGYIGTSSLNSVSTLYNRETGERLARNVNQVVLVDRSTRKPSPLPDWWKTKYGDFVVENERLVVQHRPVPPTTVHQYNMKITWSDTDSYKHTNYLSYVKFCLDAACDAIDRSFYRFFVRDILEYDVKDIESSYSGESVAGEAITISTWQDENIDQILYFSIANASGKIIFQSRMSFHLPQT